MAGSSMPPGRATRGTGAGVGIRDFRAEQENAMATGSKEVCFFREPAKKTDSSDSRGHTAPRREQNCPVSAGWGKKGRKEGAGRDRERATGSMEGTEIRPGKTDRKEDNAEMKFGGQITGGRSQGERGCKSLGQFIYLYVYGDLEGCRTDIKDLEECSSYS